MPDMKNMTSGDTAPFHHVMIPLFVSFPERPGPCAAHPCCSTLFPTSVSTWGNSRSLASRPCLGDQWAEKMVKSHSHLAQCGSQSALPLWFHPYLPPSTGPRPGSPPLRKWGSDSGTAQGTQPVGDRAASRSQAFWTQTLWLFPLDHVDCRRMEARSVLPSHLTVF